MWRMAAAAYEGWQARAAVVPGDPARDLFAAARERNPDSLALYRTSLRYVAALAKLAHRHDAKFILLHVPLPHQVSADEWREGRAANRRIEIRLRPVQPQTAS